ncbi:hypothetical protein [Amycolatopsis sp. FDAARGOS 1241]|uniref:hypothetical protein n=1 Tax=Amycolatopsis sp. FDAARGOS 1241 TaxID=2778070 RepID=UPI00194DD942|nr:hypothetical protein [Amycolatopsis sp. FDAARGOS 1241]QRP45923.1 hypothetical protein I6J71_43835 [Amycolatopsis sp. FDAARGOS 1241]
MSSARGELAALAVDRLAGRTVLPDDLVAAAVRAVVEGLDSPTLAELAGLGRDDSAAPGLFTQVVAELGIEVPVDAVTARWQLLGEALAALARGDVSVHEGSAAVRELDDRLGRPEALRELRRWLAMFDSWIPTDVTPVSFPAGQIRQQARELLAGPWPPITR